MKAKKNNAVFEELALDKDIAFLMITAGFGRVTNFENISLSEIENMFAVNTLAGIKIIKYFYHHLQYDKDFYYESYIGGPLVSMCDYSGRNRAYF